MRPFDSLTLAIEEWFDRPLGELPDALRLRAERELKPLRWDDLSLDQRRTGALQLDCKHDPAAEQDQKFWWDHYWRQDKLKAQIAQWEATAAPTAGELALRETRLKELRQELARMALQERQATGDYYPERKPPHGASETSPASQRSALQCVDYPKAVAQLRKRLDATPEELAVWIWDGPKDGGIAAYVNANELDPPPRFYFALGSGKGDDHDYVSPLMACWFRADELAEFNPANRYITGEALIKRWAERPGLKAEAWVRAKIQESRLSDLHPLYGCTQGTWPEDESLPPMTTGLFRVSDVEAIEAEDFADDHAQASAAVYAVLAHEDGAEFGDLLAALVAEHQPAGPTETHLVEELAGAIWRKRRVLQAEGAAINRGLLSVAKSRHDRQTDPDGPARAALPFEPSMRDAHLNHPSELAETIREEPGQTAARAKEAEEDLAATTRAVQILRLGGARAYKRAPQALTPGSADS